MREHSFKIAYIGGGSKLWARAFTTDLAMEEGFSGEIALYDIDRAAAERNRQIGERLNACADARSRYNYTVSERLSDALAGADFVVMSILPGSFEDMRTDVHAPEKYGIWQSVGDTAGPGGILRAMRTVPDYLGFASAIEKYCPRAWVINLTNPMSVCVGALYAAFPKIKAFGCCHEVFHTQQLLAQFASDKFGVALSRRDLSTEVTGVNHFTWLNSAFYKDNNLLDILPEYVDRYYDSGIYERGETEDFRTNPFAYANRVKFDLYKKYGQLAMGGDRHIAEFISPVPYLSGPAAVAEWKFALTTVDYREANQAKKVAETISLANGETPVCLKRSEEELIPLMRAVLGDGDVVSNVNLPNAGQAPDLPDGSVVETNAVFAYDSVTPLAAKPLTDGVHGLVLRAAENNDRCLKAIIDNDIEGIFRVFCNQALCENLSGHDAEKLFYEMTSATRGRLKQYELDGFAVKHNLK